MRERGQETEWCRTWKLCYQGAVVTVFHTSPSVEAFALVRPLPVANAKILTTTWVSTSSFSSSLSWINSFSGLSGTGWRQQKLQNSNLKQTFISQCRQYINGALIFALSMSTSLLGVYRLIWPYATVGCMNWMKLH